jgi:iron complex outermembrane recepter protein
MSIEIQKLVRQILAPMVVAVPCMALMAAAPALAAAQSADQSSSSTNSDPPQSTQSNATVTSPPTATPKLKQVLIVAPEEAVATVSYNAFRNESPAATVVSVLNNIPGFNAESLSPMGFLVADQAFTLDGFTSDEVASTFDGVPDLNTFLGGLYGNSDQPAATPLALGQVAGVKVYSGANTMSESSIDDLGGTVSYEPALPTQQFHVDVGMTGGEYAGGGSDTRESIGINSGALSSLNGLNVLANFSHTLLHGPWDNVVGRLNSEYLAVVQPTSSGEVHMIVAVNTENSQPPTYVPLPLAGSNYDYNFPMDVSYTNQEAHNTFVDIGMKSLLSADVIGEVKAFYVGAYNDRIGYGNPIYDNTYDGYSYDLDVTLKSCSALNAYESSSHAPGSYPEVYDCNAATSQFGSAAAGTAYQRYDQNFHHTGALGNLTILLPDNTVKVGAMGFIAQMLSEESWFGSYPPPIGTTGYNMAWLEHDGQTWYNVYLEDDIALLDRKLTIYPSLKWNSLDMFSNDDQGYYYDYSGSVEETYNWLERSIGVNYAFTHALNAYVNYGQSTKPPDVSALYGNIGASQEPVPPPVKPEYVNNIDAGVRFKNPYYSWDVAFFNRDFENIFSETYSDVTGITLTYNAGKALFRGFTVDGAVQLPYHFALAANGGYTSAKYTESFTNVNGVTIGDGDWRPDIPEQTGNLSLEYSNGPWYGSLSEHYRGSEYVANYATGATTNIQLGGFGTLNLDGTYTLQVDSATLRTLKLELHVDNLMNRHSIIYSPGYEINEPASPNFLWGIYNTPLFASLSVTASFF